MNYTINSETLCHWNADGSIFLTLETSSRRCIRLLHLRRLFQQTGVHLFVCYTHTHTHWNRLTLGCQFRGGLRPPREPMVGRQWAKSEWGSVRGGRGGAVGLLESNRRILSETESCRLTETAHSCVAAMSLTGCTQPPFLCPQHLGYQDNGGLVGWFFWFCGGFRFCFFGSIKQYFQHNLTQFNSWT